MSKFLLSATKKGDWHINAQELIEKIEDKWSNSKGILSKSPTVKIRFEIKEGDKDIDVHLHRSEDCIVVEGEKDVCSSFIIWIYSTFQPTVPLLLYNEAFTEHCVINGQTTAEEIASSFK